MDAIAHIQTHEFISKLYSPITDFQTLLSLLSAPLSSLGLLPPRYHHLLSATALGLESSSLKLIPRKHLPQIQRALLTNILPTWYPVLKENNACQLVEQYFCPDAIYNARPIAGEIALSAYATFVSLASLTEQAMTLLEKLVVQYPLDRLFRAIFEGENGTTVRRSVQWEDCVRDLCTIPVKVANAFGGQVPRLLENAVYFNALGLRTETLIFSLSLESVKLPEISSALCYLINKFVNIGIFPPHPPTTRSQPSFFISSMPHIRSHVSSKPKDKCYSDLWSSILLGVPTVALRSILSSFFSSLLGSLQSPLALDDAPSTRVLIKREAAMLEGVIGRMTPSPERVELWEVATGVILDMSKEWTEGHARLFVCWTSGSGSDFNALEVLLDKIVETWASSEHIKHSLLSRHKYTTSLFLLTLSYLPGSSPAIQNLILHPSFIRSISTYISHMDTSVRRCGMLVAEEAARLTGKKLEFGGWEGEGGILNWARDIRRLMKTRDVDVDLSVLQEEDNELAENSAAKEEIISPPILESTAFGSTLNHSVKSAPAKPGQNTDAYDSDDSLKGYASPPSSRSPSPSFEDLKEIEEDPTLNIGVKKLPRPVYLAQLGELLRGQPGMQAQKPDEPHEADRVEMALNVAEELIRRKRAYGTELDENAVNLACGFLGLHDKYESEGFAEKRQGVINSLVVCAPRKTAPVLVEEFFKNQYSTDQRFVALNALAIGARELASLSVPPSLVPSERTTFPSKLLSAPLHKKYITAGKERSDVLPLLMDELSTKALSKEREANEHHPELVRERRLRIQPPVRIAEVDPHGPLNQVSKPNSIRPSTKFIDVAAEYFIVPLINRFWAFLRDEQAREERTSFRAGRDRYRGAGTGMILNPVVLAQFLRTLGILVHASQSAPEWLNIIAPDALELAVTVGTRPIPHLEVDDDDEIAEEKEQREASVLTSGLEVALVVLDAALEIDGGKILSLEHTTLVLAVGEWAGKVFASLEKGLKVPGGGGVHEAKLSRAAAGVLLRVDDVSSKWRRSMLDTR